MRNFPRRDVDSFSSIVDRCREYRALQIQLASNEIELTVEQYERVQVRLTSILFFY